MLPSKPKTSQFLYRSQLCFSTGCDSFLFRILPLVQLRILLIAVDSWLKQEYEIYWLSSSGPSTWSDLVSLFSSLASISLDRLFPPGYKMAIAALNFTSQILVHVKKCLLSSQKAQQSSLSKSVALVGHLWTVNLTKVMWLHLG